MRYEIKAVLSNAQHPEYGQITIPFPIPNDQYDQTIEMLQAMELGFSRNRDCMVNDLDSWYSVLKSLTDTLVNVDQLDYLAKRLDSFTESEAAQFQAMAHKLELAHIKDLINLTFCCQQATVITDFSNLEAIGRAHYMNSHGGCADSEELANLDGHETALLLIDSGAGVITPYGVVYDNGMKLEQLYNGRRFPAYVHDHCVMMLEITPKYCTKGNQNPEYLYLPAPAKQIERTMLRAGIDTSTGLRMRLEFDELPEKVGETLDLERLSGDDLPALNRLCRAIEPMKDTDMEKLNAVVLMAKPNGVGELCQLAENLDQFDFRRHDMNTISKEWLDFLRRQFPEGSRIKLREMKDDPCPVKPGTMGTLAHIDDIGTFHVKWDDGRDLGLVLEQDDFSVLPPPVQTLKLYMPMTVDYFEDDGYGYLSDDMVTLSPSEAAEFAPQIIAALQKERALMERSMSPDEIERGLMAYYYEKDAADSPVSRKVQSYHFTAEVRDGRLWGVAECKVRGQLTPEELEKLMDNISGQASDGAGESFEQREISIGGVNYYAHLWQSEDWNIMPEQERFDPHFAERLPDICWSVLPEDGSLIHIAKGVGYQVSKDSMENPGQNRRMADYHNRERGISQAQEQAMLQGCLSGWDSPAADPKTYTQEQQGGMQFG